MNRFCVTLVLIVVFLARSFSFSFTASPIPNNGRSSLVARRSAPADSDFEKPVAVRNSNPDAVGAVDPNVYNVGLELAADLWTVSVSESDRMDRASGVPFMDCKSKNHFVDDVSVVVSRDGGMGIELLELAGGRNDDYGLTIVSGVSGNAERAGVVAGDSIASVEVQKISVSTGGGGDDAAAATSVRESREMFDCECKNFDSTIGLLGSFPPEVDSLVLNLKRIRRWPKISVVVEYPPSQCADGVDNKETVELFAGENLKRALQTRGVVFEDRNADKCDFCGQKCAVSIDMGMQLMNPMSLTEEKLMKRNPKCRLSCKTVVGYNMQEGNVRLRINLNEWATDNNKKEAVKNSPFFSK